MEVEFLFAGIGAIILIGFLGALLFQRTKIPDILILVFIGLFIGPILLAYTDFSLLQDSDIVNALATIAPYFAALALVIILFDGGLNLNLDKTMKKLGVAILHTSIAFLGTMFVTAIVCYYFLGITNPIIGLLLGCVIGGVSSAVVIPIMTGVSANEDSRTLLTLESVLSDVMCIVTALILIEILRGGPADTGALIQQLLSTFILAGFIGFLFGVLWLNVLTRLEGKPFSFMITIGALFMLYAFVEFIDVSGAIAALVFGMVLSNKDEIARILKIRTGLVFDESIKQFHSEVSFLVRTFFFVYLGLTFTLSFSAWSYDPQLPFNIEIPAFIADVPMYMFILILLVLFLGILIVRYIAASITCAVDKEVKPDKSYLYTMLPRGLAAAVLAALPFTIPEFLDSSTGYFTLMSSHEELFLNMAFMMIVLTVIATTVGVSAIERKRRKLAEEEQEGEDKEEWVERSRSYRKHIETSPKPKKSWRSPKAEKPTVKPQIVREHPPPPKEQPPPPPSTQKKPPRKPRERHPLLKRASEHKKRYKPK